MSMIKAAMFTLSSAAPLPYGNPFLAPCLRGELNMSVSGIPGLYCAPRCNVRFASGCNPSKPSDTLAVPECTIAVNSTENNYCALICNTDAKDDQCDVEGGASCHHVSGVQGVCAYNASGANAAAVVAASAVGTMDAQPSFVIANDAFVRDGVPMQIAAGEIHYSRVPVEYWADRLQRLRAMGLNSIQTYVPWNWHVAKRGKPDFSGNRNLSHFITLAQEADLLVVVRAGPYMCGEWEFGGLPAWLFENGTTPIRTDAEPYMSLALEYWNDQLMPQIAPLLYSKGGPVVMVQVENEYGSYGDVSSHSTDHSYMTKLIASARTALGPDIVLMTTDGGSVGYMTRGSIKGASVYTVGDGCGNPQACADAQKQFNAPGMSPFMCSECYTGWLTHWGEGGANTSSSAGHVAAILAHPLNGSISLYMGHGGTNFGFWSGANGGGGSSFQPHETSYDYSSPVSEAGEHGFHSTVDKYVAMQSTLAKAQLRGGGGAPPAELPLPPREAFGTVVLTERVPLFDALDALSPGAPSGPFDTAPTMESMDDCPYGYALYTMTLGSAAATLDFKLAFGDLKDRVQVFTETPGSKPVYRTFAYRVTSSTAAFSAAKGEITPQTKLHLLLENMGRINFSHGMDAETKGVGVVTLNGVVLKQWTARCLAFDYANEVAKAPFKAASGAAFDVMGPVLYKGHFAVKTIADTFVMMKGWTKGSVWINGFNIGRYWQPVGPQQTLFVPGPKLRVGSNEIVVLELSNGTADASVNINICFVLVILVVYSSCIN